MPLTGRQKAGIGVGLTGLFTAIVAFVTRKPPIPKVCTPGEPDTCFNSDLYRCSMEGKWELLQEDSSFCVVAPTRLHGKVRDKADPERYIAGVLVEIVDTALSDTTDSGGNYSIADTPFGTVTLKFTGPEKYKVLTKAVELTAGINNRIEDVFLEYIPEIVTGNISGRLEELDVVTGFTTPIPNIEVSINGYSTYCDSEGYFLFTDMPFRRYSTITAPGYKPLPIDLDLMGDVDLGVVQMVAIGVEFVITLDKLEISPASVVVGVAVEISCRAGLSIAPVGEEVTRTVTLYINGSAVDSKTITLVRTNKYWPASTTVRFEYAPATSGTYDVEVDGLTGSFEAIEYINYATLTAIEKVLDIRELMTGFVYTEANVMIAEHNIELLNVPELGFDGTNLWFTATVSHNEPPREAGDKAYGWRIYAETIHWDKADDYINRLNSLLGFKIPSGWKTALPQYPAGVVKPEVAKDSFFGPISLWIDHADREHPMNEEVSDTIYCIGKPYKGSLLIPKYISDMYTGGNFVVFITAIYRKGYSIDHFKVWKVGEIAYWPSPPY